MITRIEFPPLVTIQNSSDLISRPNLNKREENEQLSAGIACGFSHVDFLLFNVVVFFLSFLLRSFLFVLISFWYSVYFLVSIKWLDHCSLSLSPSRSFPYNFIRLRAWCLFYFYTFRLVTRRCLAFSSQVSTVAWCAPLTNENGTAVSFNFSLKQRLMAELFPI